MITSTDMRELEECCEQVGITRAELMENAGRGIAGYLEDKYATRLKAMKVLIVCGGGNNGGDGFVAGRYLYGLCRMDVLFMGSKATLPNEAAINYSELKALERNLIVEFEKEGMHIIDFNSYDVIVDALVGVGMKEGIRSPYSQAVRCINSAETALVISVDIPSGMQSDLEQQPKNSLYVDSDVILALHDTKPCLKPKPIAKKTIVLDIGIPF